MSAVACIDTSAEGVGAIYDQVSEYDICARKKVAIQCIGVNFSDLYILKALQESSILTDRN